MSTKGKARKGAAEVRATSTAGERKRAKDSTPLAPASDELRERIAELLGEGYYTMEAPDPVADPWRSPGQTLAAGLRLHPELIELDSADAEVVVGAVLVEFWDSGVPWPDGGFGAERPDEGALPWRDQVAERFHCTKCKVPWGDCSHSRGDRTGAWGAALGYRDNFDKQEFPDPLIDFLERWDAYQVTRFQIACHRVDADPLWREPGVFGRRRAAANQVTQRRFLALCVELARQSEDGRFYLPRTKWSQVLGVHPTVIGRWRTWAAEDGFIAETSPPTPGRGSAQLAAVYEWCATWDRTGRQWVPLHQRLTAGQQIRADAGGGAETWATVHRSAPEPQLSPRTVTPYCHPVLSPQDPDQDSEQDLQDGQDDHWRRAAPPTLSQELDNEQAESGAPEPGEEPGTPASPPRRECRSCGEVRALSCDALCVNCLPASRRAERAALAEDAEDVDEVEAPPTSLRLVGGSRGR